MDVARAEEVEVSKVQQIPPTLRKYLDLDKKTVYRLAIEGAAGFV